MQDNDWQWGKKEVKAFNAAGLAESATIAYFDVKKVIEIVVDASPVGLAAPLVQEKRVVVYRSRELSDVETRYSQMEREALAVVWACEHFDKFIYINFDKFTVISDHKPLETIWKKPRPPLRVEHWGLRLQPYRMVIKYQPGADIPANYMFRHPAGQGILRCREHDRALCELGSFCCHTDCHDNRGS